MLFKRRQQGVHSRTAQRWLRSQPWLLQPSHAVLVFESVLCSLVVPVSLPAIELVIEYVWSEKLREAALTEVNLSS